MTQPFAKKRILLVEDDPPSRRVLAGLLRPTYDVLVAADGAEGLDAAIAEPHPDLVVTDLSMEGMGGLELARRLRADDRTQNVPVVFLTAHGGAADLVASHRAGARFHLTKPVNVDLLLATLEHLLRQ